MSVDNNDTSKIYPTLGPSAPLSQEVNPQTYRLAKISEIEAYFLDEIDTREKLAKKTKRFSTITTGHKSNYNYSYHWRYFYCCHCQRYRFACRYKSLCYKSASLFGYHIYTKNNKHLQL